MSVYAGNFSKQVDWQSVIDHLEDSDPGDLFDGNITRVLMARTATETEDQMTHEHGTLKRFIDNNFHIDALNWTNYRPGKHYGLEIGDTISKLVGGKYVTCMISKVPSGGVCGFHYDSNFNSDKPMKRYICFISPPAEGQVFILEKETFSNIPFGDCYCWDSLSQWHGAANVGFTPLYLYTIECEHS
jgi:hypothetical protein